MRSINSRTTPGRGPARFAYFFRIVRSPILPSAVLFRIFNSDPPGSKTFLTPREVPGGGSGAAARSAGRAAFHKYTPFANIPLLQTDTFCEYTHSCKCTPFANRHLLQESLHYWIAWNPMGFHRIPWISLPQGVGQGFLPLRGDSLRFLKIFTEFQESAGDWTVWPSLWPNGPPPGWWTVWP